MGWESFDVVRFDLGPLLQGQTRIAKLKNNSLIIGPRGFQCETNLEEIMGWESFDVVRFDLGPLLQGQMRIAKLKNAYNSLIIGFTGLQFETILRKSCAGNLLMWSDLTFKIKWGQPNLKVLITRLLLILEVWDVKPKCRIALSGNLLM